MVHRHGRRKGERSARKHEGALIERDFLFIYELLGALYESLLNKKNLERFFFSIIN